MLHKNKRISAWLVIGGALLALIAGVAFIITRQSGARDIAPAPTYKPYPMDALAVPYEQIEGADELPQLDAEVYKLRIWHQLSADAEGNCLIRFVNAPFNPCYLMFDLRIAQTNKLLYRSGMIKPGEGIQTIKLSDAAMELLGELTPQVNMTLNIYSFALETYQSMGEISLNLPLMTAR